MNTTELDWNSRFADYLPKLIRLAEGRIAIAFAGKFDADDIAATVCRTVARRLNEGKFKFEDDEGLWRLLVTIAKRKISNKVREFRAQSRNIEGEVSQAAHELIAAPDPDPSEVAAFEECLHLLQKKLEPHERKILGLRLEGHDFVEIAQILACSERTVRRKMDVIRATLAEIYFNDASGA